MTCMLMGSTRTPCRTPPSSFGDIDNFTFKVEAMLPIPEPSTAVLLLGGLGVLAYVVKRRRSGTHRG
jgi:hypothetical protein